MTNGNELLLPDEGAKMIIDYCNMLATRAGVILKQIYWATNPANPSSSHTLTIEAESNVITLEFNPRDIEQYPERIGSEKTQRKLKKALLGMQG
jgi:hypothetical protein